MSIKTKTNKLPCISVEMTDEDIINRVALLFGNKYQKNKCRKIGYKQSFSVRLRGKKSSELMKILYPLMGIRRKQQIDLALSNYDPDFYKQKYIHRKILTDDVMKDAIEFLIGGYSLRKVARNIGVHHESLRCRLKILGYSSNGRTLDCRSNNKGSTPLYPAI